MPGSLPIACEGCGEWCYLAVTGADAGTVWEWANGWMSHVPTPFLRPVTYSEWVLVEVARQRALVRSEKSFSPLCQRCAVAPRQRGPSRSCTRSQCPLAPNLDYCGQPSTWAPIPNVSRGHPTTIAAPRIRSTVCTCTGRCQTASRSTGWWVRTQGARSAEIRICRALASSCGVRDEVSLTPAFAI
jgi:hypothetical protein